MPWFKKQKQVNLLEMVPYHFITNYTETDNLVTLLLPKFKNPTIVKWLIPGEKSKHIHVNFDANGSQVWRLIDGNRNVQEICDAIRLSISTQSPMTDLEERTAKFITQLYKSRFIKFKEEQSCLK